MTVAIKATSTSKKAWRLTCSSFGGSAGEESEQGLRVHTSDPLTFPAPEGYRGLCHSTGCESPATPRQLP